ncbi:MAG: hypothetical protein OXK82_07435 [Deltaproteobacteria bacterium]|nr:hypothetical protein [Deltaproteobacteria bacterium]MDE0214880.1 hypothetical protein [Deltaproteobacteria bacterium]MDE0342982.1 hypothetical protein [Deltaproteobacteria bacterium]
MNETEKYLIDVAYPFWETEAEIARRFFRNNPTREQHVYWLKAQLWKELHPVDGYFTGLHRELANLVEMFPQVDRTVDRHHYHGLMEQMVQEFNHYVLQADILEYLLGRKIAAEDTIQLPEEKALGDLRRAYVAGSAVEKAAVLVTEGGGARLFREGRKLKGSVLARKIAAAMEVVYQDEKNHYREAAREAAAAVGNKRHLKTMKRAIERVSLQRVRMRNEMFQYPLSEEGVERCVAKHYRPV